MRYCPYCHIANRDGSHYCNGCGQPFDSANLTCPACGSDNLAGARFCQQCGAHISSSVHSVPVIDLSPNDPELPDLEADIPDLAMLANDGLTEEDWAIIAWSEAFAAPPAPQLVDDIASLEDQAIIAWYEALSSTPADHEEATDARADDHLDLPDWLFLTEPAVEPEAFELPAWLFLEEPTAPAVEALESGPIAPEQAENLAPTLEPERPMPQPKIELLPDWLFLPEPIELASPVAPTSPPEPARLATPEISPPMSAPAEPPALPWFAPIAEPTLLPPRQDSESAMTSAAVAEPPRDPIVTGLPFTPAPGSDVESRLTETSAIATTSIEVIAEEMAAAVASQLPPAHDYGGAWSFVRSLREQIAADEAAAQAEAEREAAGLPPIDDDRPAGNLNRPISEAATKTPAIGLARPLRQPAEQPVERTSFFSRLRITRRVRKTPQKAATVERAAVAGAVEPSGLGRRSVFSKLFRRQNSSPKKKDARERAR